MISAVYLGNNRVLAELPEGYMMMLDTDDISVAPHILRNGYWEPALTLFAKKHIRPGDVVVEVGSNFGYFTLLAAKLVGSSGKVFAFEADPEVYSFLKTNVIINYQIKTVSAFNFAVCDQVGEVSFQKLNRLKGSGSLKVAQYVLDVYSESTTNITVPSTTLDHQLEEISEQITFLKIDAEGAEELILKGMSNILSRNRKLAIIMEFAGELLESVGTNPRHFLLDLANRGFNFWNITNNGDVTRTSVEAVLNSGHADILLTR